MLSTRLLTGTSMAGITIAILFLDETLAPWYPLWFVLAVAATGAAALELIGLLGETSARPSPGLVLGGVFAIVLANWVPHLVRVLHRLPAAHGEPAYDPLAPVGALAWPMLTFTAVLMLAFLVESLRFQKPGGTMPTIAGSILAIAYIGLLGTFLIQVRWFDGPYHGLIPLGYLITSAKGADTGAYTFGRIAGRHKLWPRISPNKTVEGAIGGLVFAAGGALLVGAICRYALHIHTIGWGTAAAFGLVVGAAAQLGDLMESMIKRDCARKDASAAVPGFGGVLDVLDSLLYAGPVAFGFWLSFVS